MFCRKHDCKWVGCLLWIFTAFLAVLLVIQIPFLLLLTLNRELMIPSQWVEKAINHKLGDSYRVSVQSATINEFGTVELSNIEVCNSYGRPVAEAESVCIDFYLPSLVFGIANPEQIKASQVQWFDTRGPLGANETVITLDALNLIRDQNSWAIQDARILWENLPIAITGELKLPKRKVGPFTTTMEDPLPMILEKLDQLELQMPRVKDPFLVVELRPEADLQNQATLTLLADRVELPFGIRLENEVRLTSSATFSTSRIAPGPIVMRGKDLYYGEEIRVHRPSLRMDPPGDLSSTAFFAGGAARLAAASISTPTVTLDDPTVQITAGRSLTLNLSGQTSLFGNAFSLEGSANLLRRTAELKTAGIVSVNEAIEHPALPDIARQYPIEFKKGAYLEATAQFTHGNWIPETIRFHAESESFDILGFTAVQAQANGTILPQSLVIDIDDLSIQKPAYHLNARYRHDFRSNEFRFQVFGGFMPMDISGWMQEWWDEIWEDFVIHEVPYVDLDMNGDWDHHDDRRIYGGIRFRNIELHGMEIDHGYSQLRTYPYIFELIDLHAFRPEGQASGYSGILLDWETRNTYARIYDLTSSLTFEKIAPLFGEELEEPLSEFKLSAPPELSIRGILFPPIEGKTSPHDHLRVDASTDSPLTYRDIQLQRLTLSALYSQHILRLDPIQFGLGGGTGTGWIVRRPEDSPRGRNSIRLNFIDGIPSEVVQAIPRLKNAVGERMDADEDTDPEDQQVSFSIECSGDINRPETLLGEGHFSLDTPNLANVRLLGILSRISEELPLPITLGSFRFEHASSSFLLNRGLVEFPNLILKSPSSQLLAEGAYQMADKTIDFNARMQLLGGIKFPILAQIGALLKPFGRVFEFRLWGPLDDLDWRLYLDPRSW
ncbi:MAG: hypothetical protein ACQKBT_01905 [Puniceicoccales bacterium]